MSLAKSAIRGGLWVAGIRYVSFIINFVGNIWLARLLVPADFGVFALAMSISEILFMIGGFGLAQACIQLQDQPKVFDTGLVFAWALTALLSIIGLISAWIAKDIYAQDVAIFLAVLCLIKSLQFSGSVYLAYLEKEFAFRKSAFISGFGRSIAICLAIVLAIWGFGKWSLLLREVMAIGFVFLGSLVFSPFRFGFSFDKSTAQKIWRFSFGMFFMRMSEVLFNRAPNFLLGSLAGPATLGLFERSLYVSNLPNTMLSQFYGKVGFAVFSKVKNQPDKIAYGLEWNLFWVSRITFFAGGLVLIFPEFILTSLLGEKWSEAASFFQGFSFFIAILPLFSILKQGLLASGAITAVTFSRVFSILVVVGAVYSSWVMGDIWELLPWSMSAGAFLGLIVLAVSAHKKKIFIKWIKIIWLPLIFLLLMLCLFFFILPVWGTWKDALSVFLIYIAALFVLDRYKFNQLYQIIKS
ncbi:hypothetical protein AKJ60_00095 [candidate division MSBL1 archaeon SCGC-AAA385M11]|nr:hypothetical protein AKJ60_00095 [candidate division MSBL1 archaeon SCGC-AAA385M11]